MNDGGSYVGFIAIRLKIGAGQTLKLNDEVRVQRRWYSVTGNLMIL